MLTNFCTWACLCLWVSGASSSPAMPRTEARAAPADDVNVLMYGVLQFSESLHHAHQSTEAKLARIARVVTDTESLVQRLRQDAERTARSERQIKDRLGDIQAETAALRVQAQQTKGQVHTVEQGEEALRQKVTHLEATLKRFTPDRIKALKEVTQKHNTLLQDLVSWTVKHKERLEDQNQQLAELHKRTSGSV